ncbi:MAG: alpha-glucosidase [Eubacteriales bacterium]
MEQKWWHSAIGYEIYPKSFKDGNGDGIGDLYGVLEKLDYLADLGINLIWLCPINKSPMVDHGYDVADYEEIDPIFGDKDTLKLLITEAKKRDIKIILDLVVNHSSDQHEWFQKALANPDGPYGDYYIFRKGTATEAPNNWYGIFNGSTWEKVGDDQSDLYYLHIFTKEQPDLNWENQKLREEIYGMIRRWLDFGIAGFRVDAISHVKKNFNYTNQHSERPDGLYNGMAYFNNVTGIVDILQELKSETFAQYDCFTVGEANTPTPAQLSEYAGENGHFSSVFDFFHTPYHVEEDQFRDNPLALVELLKEKIFNLHQNLAKDVFLTNITENHDNARSIDKFIPKNLQNFHSASLLGSVNFFLRGIPFLYQGQEIGMKNYPKKKITEYKDPTTLRQYDEKLLLRESPEEALSYYNRASREHSRTPMQWDSSENAGFSTGIPWFEVNPNKNEIHVEKSLLLAYYKKMIALRKNPDYQDNWIYGDFSPLFSEKEGLISYERRHNGQKICCLFQCRNSKCTIFLKKDGLKVLLSNYETNIIEDATITLRPFEVLILEIV